ncbi:MAG TPA: hypothetical protein VMV38_01985 [Candidatus Paceibacterota bacterium]|nr:hypothetical protein [Candidatus Paceibacterota bacterium]
MNYAHAFVIEAEAEEGIGVAEAWITKELGMSIKNNPDVVVLRHGLFSIAEARNVTALSQGSPFSGRSKVVIITAHRAYHEAQNALLKVFEEPPPGTYLFFIVPSLGGLLPTLRSRVQVLDTAPATRRADVSQRAKEFLTAGKEKRSALIKKLATGKDEEERRAHREEAIALITDIETATYALWKKHPFPRYIELLSDIATVRSHLYDRSAPVRMILEHLALVLPKDLV